MNRPIYSWSCFTLLLVTLLAAGRLNAAEYFLGQGTMSGEVDASSALVQTRLTASTTLDEDGDLPGIEGLVRFDWGTDSELAAANQTPLRRSTEETDYIGRVKLDALRPETTYY